MEKKTANTLLSLLVFAVLIPDADFEKDGMLALSLLNMWDKICFFLSETRT